MSLLILDSIIGFLIHVILSVAFPTASVLFDLSHWLSYGFLACFILHIGFPEVPLLFKCQPYWFPGVSLPFGIRTSVLEGKTSWGQSFGCSCRSGLETFLASLGALHTSTYTYTHICIVANKVHVQETLLMEHCLQIAPGPSS